MTDDRLNRLIQKAALEITSPADDAIIDALIEIRDRLKLVTTQASPPTPLPTIEQMTGLIDDVTGGVSLKDHLNALRGESASPPTPDAEKP